MTNTLTIVIATLALVVSGVALMGGGNASLGGQFDENVHKTFWRGITVGDEGQFTISREGEISTISDLTFGSDGATTTLDLNLFCFEYHPTSTLTTYHIRASSTAPTGNSPFYAQPGGC